MPAIPLPAGIDRPSCLLQQAFCLLLTTSLPHIGSLAPLQLGFFLLFARFLPSSSRSPRCNSLFSSYSLTSAPLRFARPAATRFFPLIRSLPSRLSSLAPLQLVFFLLFAHICASSARSPLCNSFFPSYSLISAPLQLARPAATRFFPLIRSLPRTGRGR